MIELWPFQIEAVQAVHKEFATGIRRTLVSMPTGTGKTIVICACVQMALQAGNRCLVVVPSTELVDQTVEKLARIGIHSGVVKQNRDEWQHPVVIAQYQTLARRKRLARIPPDWFRFVMIDEAHMSYSPSIRRIMRYMCTAWFIGFTATPFRGDRKSLALANWGSVAYVYTLDKAVEDGYLAKPIIVRISTNVNLDTVAVSKVPREGGLVEDFRSSSLEKAINTPERNLRIARAFMSECGHVRAIAFCVTRKHALDLANSMRSIGIAAGMVHYEMDPSLRRAALDAHKAGRLQVLTNVSVLSQGYDDNGIGCVIMARPTLSKTLFVQCVGRGLRGGWRLDPDKRSCTILDVVDSCSRHKLAVTNEVFDLKHDMADVSLGIVTSKERLGLYSGMVKLGLEPSLVERVAYSDSLTRSHLTAYSSALAGGRLSNVELRQILGLGGARG
jgi:superfamily II DNA or RNA helicase